MEKQQTKTPIQRAATIARITIGVLLMPILFAMFIADRIILVFLPWTNGETVQETFKNLANFTNISYRVGFVLFVYLLTVLFKYLF
jgi:hypothetical protein